MSPMGPQVKVLLCVFQIITVSPITRAVSKVRGLAAVRRCYAEVGGDC
jgi:hypothetical protein